jgi:hypothetical protein
MSQFLDYNYNKSLEDLLATLISLRVFTIRGSKHPNHHTHTEKYLPYITEVSDRAPHLELFSIFEGRSHLYVKRVCGKWVICGEAEFPSHKLEL